MSSIRLWLGLLPVVCINASHAYEDDIHFGLTKWLAQKAGYSESQAHLIAKANVDYDHSELSAISLVKHSACYGRDPIVSREVRKIHFPSEAPVPSEPADRKVDPGSDAARSAYQRVLAVPAKSEEENLNALGQALHPLQDSWSHQGIPDSPLSPACDRKLSWGHPEKRGGWRSHQADIAHRYSGDALRMAEATYSALCESRKKLYSTTCQRQFNSISAEVFTLVQLNTKAAKAAWFKERNFSNVAFLYATSVPDGNTKAGHEPSDYSSASLSPIRKSNEGALPNSPEAAFMRAFFHRWMTSNDITSVVKEFFALNAYRDNLGSGEARQIAQFSAEVQLRFWRVRDHGLIQQSLEGDHNLIVRPLQGVPTVIEQGDQPYPQLGDALLPLDASGLPIATWTTRREDGSVLWVGAARIRHAPYELVIVVAERIDGVPRVVSLSSTVTN